MDIKLWDTDGRGNETEGHGRTRTPKKVSVHIPTPK